MNQILELKLKFKFLPCQPASVCKAFRCSIQALPWQNRCRTFSKCDETRLDWTNPHTSHPWLPMTINCIILQHPIALGRYIVNINEYWILNIWTSSRSAPEKLHSLWISANERHDVVRNILSSKKSTEYIWGETYPENFFRARILVRDEASERIEHTFRVLKVHKKLAVHFWRLKPQTRYQYALNLSKDPPDMQRLKMNNTLTKHPFAFQQRIQSH